MKIGIIDWGIGGVSLLKRIRQSSNADILYFSDTGFTPYGKVPQQELKGRLEQVIDYLRLRECEVIAVACNAASTVLPEEENVFGVIQPALELVKEMKLERLGIVGGKRTIESEIYKRSLEEAGMKIQQQIAQPLSARIESGDLHSEDLRREIETIFTPLKEEKNILLACTHYPVIATQINQFLPMTRLIDPIEKMCDQLLTVVGKNEGKGKTTWLTSGNIHEMYRTIHLVYGIDAKTIERKPL